MPDGELLSLNDALVPPLLPHAPEEPSTWRQSDGLPEAPSMEPSELMTAALLVENPGPSSSREARSAVRPVTCDSKIGPVVILPPEEMLADDTLTRTALTLSGTVLTGTDHVSWNCTRPSLLYTTV